MSAAINVQPSGLTRAQEMSLKAALLGDDSVATALLARLASQVQLAVPWAPSNVNNTMPAFTPEPDWEKVVNRTRTTLLTANAVKDFFVTELARACPKAH